MHNLSEEERELVEQAQKALAVAKMSLNTARENMRKMVKIQIAANRVTEANACMRMEGGLEEVLGLLKQHHATASDALCDCFEEGGIIALGGGGR